MKLDISDLNGFGEVPWPPIHDFKDIFEKQVCQLCNEKFQGENWQTRKRDHLVKHFKKDFPEDPCQCVLINYKSEEYYHVWGYAQHVSNFNLKLFEAMQVELGDSWCLMEDNAEQNRTQDGIYAWLKEQVKGERIAYELVTSSTRNKICQELVRSGFNVDFPRKYERICQLCKPEHRMHLFDSDQALRIHQGLVHERGVTFVKMNLPRKTKTRKGPVYRHECEQCNEKFELETDFTVHMLNEHPEED